MTQVNLLSVDDIVQELATGRATVKYMLDRFSTLLGAGIDGSRYSPDILPILIQIRDLMASGLLPSQIQELLEGAAAQSSAPPPSGDIRLSPAALGMIQNLFEEICAHQDRVARAHEKRAEVEARKALAIEKRAAAEEKKAAAMNNIAMALQEMNQLRAVDAQAMEIAGQTARALSMTEEQIYEKEDAQDPVAGLDTLLDHPEPDPAGLDPSALDLSSEPSAPDESDVELSDPGLSDLDPFLRPAAAPNGTGLDDLSLLIDEPGLSSRDLDDLSALIDTVSSSGGKDIEAASDTAPSELDDLSQLIDQEGPDLDNLYALVNDQDQIRQSPAPDGNGLDDLSLLIDDPGRDKAAPEDMDDLQALVSDTSAPAKEASPDMNAPQVPGEPVHPMDDLWSLVDNDKTPDRAGDEAVSEPVSLKPDITPEQDMARYKAAVMQIIIDLKSRGLSAQETTDRLNRDDVPTLSGKPKWREAAIAKIYGFIDSAR